MNRSELCPDLAAWRLFHAADGSNEELDRLAAHQEACAACRAVLASLDSLPGLLSGRYKLLPEIGRGGMGVVYAARDVVLKRDVAVKVLSAELKGRPETLRRFIEEAEITSQLPHPGIPSVHDLGELPDGRPFLVMKLIKGRKLADLLCEQGPSPTRWLGVFEAICQAVGYAHSQGIIHRDLKPANVMLGEFGEVQVMDWGIAKRLAGPAPATVPTEGTITPSAAESLQPTAAEASRTQPGRAIGAWGYMPPEQANGQLEIDRRADVFGLGAMLCELLTGQPPYVGPSEVISQMALQGNLADCFARLTDCGAESELLDLAKRCLAKDPTGRPADAGEVAVTVAAIRATAEDRARNAELRVERDRANMALTCRIAERLEHEVQKLQQLAQGIATAFDQQDHWSEDQLVRWLTAELRTHPNVTNLTLGFEANMFKLDCEDYCLLVGRTSAGEIYKRQLLPTEGYEAPYREENWYAKPLRRKQPTWTGPELCLGDWTVCHEVPLRCGGEYVGVMAVDLSVSYFKKLFQTALLAEVGFGPKSYGFVVGGESSTNVKVTDRMGTFICHPEWQPPLKITELGDRAFRLLAQRILRREPGADTTVDPWTGRRSTFLFAPIRSAEWSFVAVVEEDTQPEDQGNQALAARRSLSTVRETS